MLGTLPNGKGTHPSMRGDVAGWWSATKAPSGKRCWLLFSDDGDEDCHQTIAEVWSADGQWMWQTDGEPAVASGGRSAILAAEASLLITGWDLPHLANPNGRPTAWDHGEIASWYPRSESWIAAAAARTMPLGERPAPVKPAEPAVPPSAPAARVGYVGGWITSSLARESFGRWELLSRELDTIAVVERRGGKWFASVAADGGRVYGVGCGTEAFLWCEATLIANHGYQLPHLDSQVTRPVNTNISTLETWYPRQAAWFGPLVDETSNLREAVPTRDIPQPELAVPAADTPRANPAPPAITFDGREPRDYPLPQEQPAAARDTAAPETSEATWLEVAEGSWRLCYPGVRGQYAVLMDRLNGSVWRCVVFPPAGGLPMWIGEAYSQRSAEDICAAVLRSMGFSCPPLPPDIPPLDAPERPMPAGHSVVWTPTPDDREGFLRAAEGWCLMLRHRNRPQDMPIVVRIRNGKARAACGGVVSLLAGDEYVLIAPPADDAGEAVCRGA